jgi:anti-sigma-K factor RskA
MAHEQFDEAAALYAAGALGLQERQALEAHLATGCVACRVALTEYQEVAGLLPYALSPVVVPSELKPRVKAAFLRDFPRSAQTPHPMSRAGVRRSFANWLPLVSHPAFGLASVLLLVATMIYAVSIRSRVETEVAQRQRTETVLQAETVRLSALQQQIAELELSLRGLREELAHRQGDLTDLQDSFTHRQSELEQLRTQLAQRERQVHDLGEALAQRDEIVTLLRSPRVKVVALAGVEQMKAAGALLLFDPQTKKAFFYAFNMPPLPTGKTYQLWAIMDKPVSAGTFHLDAGQKGRLLIRSVPDIAHIGKFAVSLEPEGGRPQPTGEIYLIGQL